MKCPFQNTIRLCCRYLWGKLNCIQKYGICRCEKVFVTLCWQSCLYVKLWNMANRIFEIGPFWNAMFQNRRLGCKYLWAKLNCIQKCGICRCGKGFVTLCWQSCLFVTLRKRMFETIFQAAFYWYSIYHAYFLLPNV